MKRPLLVAATVLTGLLALSGCGGGTAADTSPPALATASIDPTALPTGWPAVAFPDGTSIVSSDTGTEAGAPRLSVSFETQELPSSVTAFLDDQLTAAGYTSGGTSTDASGRTTASYTADGGGTAVLRVTDGGSVTEGSLVITSAAASATPAA